MTMVGQVNELPSFPYRMDGLNNNIAAYGLMNHESSVYGKLRSAAKSGID